jgi:glyoxylase-like metal-dependent hydrolase (beta-lactamase superfamily II)
MRSAIGSRASGRTLEAIIVTHGHADHHFGAGRLRDRSSELTGARQPAVAEHIAASIESEVKTARGLFGDAVVEPTSVPIAVDDVLQLEGHELRVIDLPQGDIAPTAIVYVAVLDAVVVYNGIHQMMAFTGPGDWSRWIESIDLIEALHPTIVIAGYKHATPSDDPEILRATRAYIIDFTDVAHASKSPPRELIATMGERYPRHGNLTTFILSATAALARA